MTRDQSTQRQGVLGRGVLTERVGSGQEREEGTGRRIVVVDGGDQQASPRAGHRAHEQTQFVVQGTASPVEEDRKSVV